MLNMYYRLAKLIKIQINTLQHLPPREAVSRKTSESEELKTF